MDWFSDQPWLVPSLSVSEHQSFVQQHQDLMRSLTCVYQIWRWILMRVPYTCMQKEVKLTPGTMELLFPLVLILQCVCSLQYAVNDITHTAIGTFTWVKCSTIPLLSWAAYLVKSTFVAQSRLFLAIPIPQEYSGHSFRVGSAMAAALVGLGDWPKDGYCISPLFRLLAEEWVLHISATSMHPRIFYLDSQNGSANVEYLSFDPSS